MEEKIFLTQEGINSLNEELNHLKTVVRLEVAKAIGEAKSFGDLSENSEYDAAKSRESQVESRIYQIENALKNAVLIDEQKIDTKKVNIGCKVQVLDVEYDEVAEYRILGANESDPEKGKISNESPMGKALIGKKVGDIVDVETPATTYQVKIIKILA